MRSRRQLQDRLVLRGEFLRTLARPSLFRLIFAENNAGKSPPASRRCYTLIRAPDFGCVRSNHLRTERESRWSVALSGRTGTVWRGGHPVRTRRAIPTAGSRASEGNGPRIWHDSANEACYSAPVVCLIIREGRVLKGDTSHLWGPGPDRISRTVG